MFLSLFHFLSHLCPPFLSVSLSFFYSLTGGSCLEQTSFKGGTKEHLLFKFWLQCMLFSFPLSQPFVDPWKTQMNTHRWSRWKWIFCVCLINCFFQSKKGKKGKQNDSGHSERSILQKWWALFSTIHMHGHSFRSVIMSHVSWCVTDRRRESRWYWKHSGWRSNDQTCACIWVLTP